MSTKLLLASLLVSSAAAALAAPSTPVAPPGPKPTPAPLPTCTAGGDVVFAIEHKADAGPSAQWRFELLSKGMYTVSRLEKGKAVFASTGCAGTPNVSRIKTAFAAATWKTTTGPACAAYAAEYVDYIVGGRVVYTERMCTGTVLDAPSRKALDTALAIVKPFDVLPVVPPTTPAPPAQP